jgi:hypothetical protein
MYIYILLALLMAFRKRRLPTRGENSANLVTLIGMDKKLHIQGCQTSYFQTKITHLGNFLRALQWKMLVYFMATLSRLAIWPRYFAAIWYILWILWPFGIFSPFWYVV